MSMRGLLLAMGACAFALAACGPPSSGTSSSDAGGGDAPGSGSTLDCTWSTSDNCWKTTVAAAAACLPPGAQQGKLSTDGKTCTYATGQTIAFASSLVIGPGAALPSFTLTSAGMPCLRFDQAPSAFTVTTSAGAVTVSGDSQQMSVSTTCQGGATYSGSTMDLSACKSAVPGKDVGEGFSAADGGYTGHLALTLEGTSDPSATQVFDCATP